MIVVAGDHDRSGAAQPHPLVWPVVLDWMGQRQSRASNGQLDRVGESTGRMTDDVIDEAIEAVLQSGGAATVVAFVP